MLCGWLTSLPSRLPSIQASLHPGPPPSWLPLDLVFYIFGLLNRLALQCDLILREVWLKIIGNWIFKNHEKISAIVIALDVLATWRYLYTSSQVSTLNLIVDRSDEIFHNVCNVVCNRQCLITAVLQEPHPFPMHIWA